MLVGEEVPSQPAVVLLQESVWGDPQGCGCCQLLVLEDGGSGGLGEHSVAGIGQGVGWEANVVPVVSHGGGPGVELTS